MLSSFGFTWSALRWSARLRRGGVVHAEGGPDQDPARRPKPKDGPPDLDELWQDFNRRINGLLGGRGGRPRPGGSSGGGSGGGGGNGSGGPLFKGPSVGAGAMIVGGVILVVWLASGLFIVQEGYASVILQFGRYKEMRGSGIQWHWPAPIQTHETVNVDGVRYVEIGYRQNGQTKVLREAQMLTDDQNIVEIQASVQYRIRDAAEFLFNNRNAEDSVMQATETALREVVGKSKLDDVLYKGREQIAITAQQLVQRILDRYKTGIQVLTVAIQRTQPPEEVQAAFDDVVRAQQDSESLKREGEAYANDVIPKARGAASRLIEEANGYKQRVINQAEGDASRFRQVLTAYAKAPAVTRDRMYLETMQQIFTNTTKVMVDARAGNNLLYLPLDKLLQATGADNPRTVEPAPNSAAGAVAPGSPAGTGATPNPPATGAAPANQAVPARSAAGDVDNRGRDALRNRDRESR